MPIPTQQKALLLTKKFGPLSVVSDFSVPKPGRDEVLVKVHASALNPVDWKIVKHGFYIEHFPTVLGSDLAGEIVQLGEGVEEADKFTVGDRVFFQGLMGSNEQGGFMQYTVTDVFTLAKIPDHISYEEAVTLPVVVNSATIGLYNVNPHGMAYELPTREGARGKMGGTPIVILGGSSSVGQAAIQLARLSGFNPIITTASLKHRLLLTSLGATHVLDRNVLFTKSLINGITTSPLKAVYDAISEADTQTQALDILESGGQVALVLPPLEETVERGKREGKIVNSLFAIKVFVDRAPLLKELWVHMTELVASGDIKPNTVELVYGGLSGVVDGLKRLEENRVSGQKLVVRPQETA